MGISVSVARGVNTLTHHHLFAVRSDKSKEANMDILKTLNLIKADGTKKPSSDALAGKDIILIYFSAHWCPPCRGFTPILKDFYEEVDGVEIIFVSSDQSQDAMVSYMKESHGDWWAVEYGSDPVRPSRSTLESPASRCWW